MDSIRPWGKYCDHFRSNQVVFKMIYVDPGKRLSLQSHDFREEVWICIDGCGVATIDSEIIELGKNVRVDINKKQIHRLENTGNAVLVIAETQIGLCYEDDIVRYEDDFGRK